MTIASWFAPWAWPAWPVLFVLNAVESRYSYPEAGPLSRAAMVVFLIAVNVGAWALLMRVLWALVRRRLVRRRPVMHS